MSYYKSYQDLMQFLYTNEKSPLKFDGFRYVGSDPFRFDGSGDIVLYNLVRDYVADAEKEGINPWHNLRFGIKDKWGKTPRVEFLPVETSPTFAFQVRYNWRCEY